MYSPGSLEPRTEYMTRLEVFEDTKDDYIRLFSFTVPTTDPRGARQHLDTMVDIARRLQSVFEDIETFRKITEACPDDEEDDDTDGQ